jgi:asparagine synthase (glutamine-hydrolysing)
LLHDTIYQDKSGFAAPVTPWLQGHLRRTARKTIFSPRALDRGYFEPASLEFFVNRFEQTGKGEWQVWMLLLFELWNKQFIDQSE